MTFKNLTCTISRKGVRLGWELANPLEQRQAIGTFTVRFNQNGTKYSQMYDSAVVPSFRIRHSGTWNNWNIFIRPGRTVHMKRRTEKNVLSKNTIHSLERLSKANSPPHGVLRKELPFKQKDPGSIPVWSLMHARGLSVLLVVALYRGFRSEYSGFSTTLPKSWFVLDRGPGSVKTKHELKMAAMCL